MAIEYLVNDSFTNNGYYYKTSDKKKAFEWAERMRPKYDGIGSTLYIIKQTPTKLELVGRVSNRTGKVESKKGEGDFAPGQPKDRTSVGSYCIDINKEFKK